MLKKILLGLGVVIVLLVVGFQIMKYNTKKASPEVLSTYSIDNNQINIFYCSPRKKGRDVFPEVVPFGEVWRTGANEASTFTNSKDILVEGEHLKAGTYSLWTIPGQEEWEIIFNSEVPGWGVGMGAKAARKAEADVLSVRVPTNVNPNQIQEELVIKVENKALIMAWDDMIVKARLSNP